VVITRPRGADPNTKCEDWDKYGDIEFTSLRTALSKEYPDIALLLLERGADVESRGGWDES
jgi:hypothetical protein